MDESRKEVIRQVYFLVKGCNEPEKCLPEVFAFLEKTKPKECGTGAVVGSFKDEVNNEKDTLQSEVIE